MITREQVVAELKALRADRRRFVAALLMAAAAAGSLAWCLTQGAASGAYALLALGLCMAVVILRHPLSDPRRYDRGAAYVLIAAAVGLALFQGVPIGWPLGVALVGAVAYFAGLSVAGWLTVPALLFLVVVPSTAYLYDLLSFPLSRICAGLTVGTLHIFGVDCSFDQAMIYVGSQRIAVTSACSGIELLEAMLLLGWLLVYHEHRTFIARFAHYLLLVPAIIVCNSLRLILVIVLYKYFIGEKAFDNTLHEAMGYGVVIAAIVILFFSGKLFEPLDKKDDAGKDETKCDSTESAG